MRGTPAACLCLLLVAPALHAQPAPHSAAETAAAKVLWGDPWLAAQRAGDIQRVAMAGGSFVERLKGDAALAHLYSVMSRRPAAFAEARRALRERGFSPTDTVYVERTIRLASHPSGRGGSLTVPAESYSEQNSDGEIVFWSWDDGQDATWEGSIYIEIYSTNAASSWEGQIDASTQQHPWIYYRKTWEGGGGGGPHETRLDGTPPRPGTFAPAVPAVMSSASTSQDGGYAFASFSSWAYCWRGFVVGGCATAAIGCLASGPLWPKCFGLGCIGVEVGCGITCAM